MFDFHYVQKCHKTAVTSGKVRIYVDRTIHTLNNKASISNEEFHLVFNTASLAKTYASFGYKNVGKLFVFKETGPLVKFQSPITLLVCFFRV
jgi:hypothetical protein